MNLAWMPTTKARLLQHDTYTTEAQQTTYQNVVRQGDYTRSPLYYRIESTAENSTLLFAMHVYTKKLAQILAAQKKSQKWEKAAGTH